MIHNGETLLPIVALHAPGRSAEPPTVFICVSDIIAVVPAGARAQLCVRGVPTPMSVDESAYEVALKIHVACGTEVPDHLREGRVDAAVGLAELGEKTGGES